MNSYISYGNGSYYKGEVNAGNLPHGKGFIRWQNGDEYEGDFRNNTVTGKGIYRYANGGVYQGEMVNGSREGRGVMTWKDGGAYDGLWKNNMRNGYGDCIFTDYKYDRYVGNWVDDRLEGEGTAYRGKTVYKGHYRENMWDGHLEVTWENGARMTGYFENDVLKGEADFTYPNGNRYVGMIDVNNNWCREGHGKLTKPDGTVLEGEFHNNQRNGLFTVSYPDGSVTVEQYEDGKLISRQETVSAAVPEGCLQVNDSDEGLPEELKKYFTGIIGMEPVKQQLEKIYKRFRVDSIRRQRLGIQQSPQGYNFLITGNPGTGKTTVARIIGKMLYDTGILTKDVLVEVDRGDLVAEYVGQTAQKTIKVIDSARGGTLFIDEAYALYRKDSPNDFGREAIDTLLKDMEDNRGQYCVIMAGYLDQMNEMIRNANPGLASRFDYRIEIPDYSADELLQIAIVQAKSRKMYIEEDAERIIRMRIEKEKIDDTFDNARFIRRLLDEAIEHQALRLADDIDSFQLQDLQILKAEDFGTVDVEEDSLEQCMDRLNSLIGLGNVKKAIEDIVQTVRVQQESRRRGLSIAAQNPGLNMVFTGNPGTGKTTVARLVGNIYYQLGLLKRNNVFVECTRAELIGRYQGETAIKVKEVIRKALGGVLFIDEAYSLINGNNDSFGQEAVNTLVSEIENNRDKLAVILAGYSREMDEFLNANSGLRSRLAHVIEFEDYTVEEMTRIFESDLKKRGYQVEVSHDLLSAIIYERSKAKDFGNARGVRNLADEVISAHNRRINQIGLSSRSNEQITTIDDRDLMEIR